MIDKVEHNNKVIELFAGLEKDLISFFQGLGHDIEVRIIHKAKETTGKALNDLENKTGHQQPAEQPAPEITAEQRQWALTQWAKHCDDDQEIMPEDWAALMLLQRKEIEGQEA